MAWQLLSKAKVLKCDETGKLGIQAGPGEEVVEIPTGGGAKERILLFDETTFTKQSNGMYISDLGAQELVDSLDVLRNNYYAILDKYKMIFYVKDTFAGYYKAELEYLPPIPLDSGYTFKSLLAGSSSSAPMCIEYNSAYGGFFSVSGITDNRTLTITCFLEKL